MTLNRCKSPILISVPANLINTVQILLFTAQQVLAKQNILFETHTVFVPELQAAAWPAGLGSGRERGEGLIWLRAGPLLLFLKPQGGTALTRDNA